MNVSTIVVSPAEAELKLKMYRDAINKRHSEEDELLESLYASVAKGARVINVAEALSTAGLNESDEPKLAIAKADWDMVHCRSLYGGEVMFSDTQRFPNAVRRRISFPRMFPNRSIRYGLKTDVPHIPIAIRPSRGLSSRFVLFEVQSWERYNVDPYLLRRIAGNLFVVEAEWELTELEASLLSEMKRVA